MDFGTRFNLWKDAFLKPVPTFTAEAKRSVGFMDGLINNAVSAAIYFVISLIGVVLFSVIAMAIGSKPALANLLMIPVEYAAAFIVVLILQFIMAGVYHLIAKLLGGKGRFPTLYYTLSLATSLIMALTGVAILIPCLGSVISLLLGLYELYLTTIAIQKTHNLSTMRAVAVWAIPLIVIIIIMVVLFIVAAAFFMTALGSVAGSLPNANMMLQ